MYHQFVQRLIALRTKLLLQLDLLINQKYETDKRNLEKSTKSTETENIIPNITGLPKKADYNRKICNISYSETSNETK